ncbi:MAG TPA: hypothetical protein VJT81_17855 [Burkholderiales bacterium]|nr:hypothetical protein [Burkholderiales bacterium]
MVELPRAWRASASRAAHGDISRSSLTGRQNIGRTPSAHSGGRGGRARATISLENQDKRTAGELQHRRFKEREQSAFKRFKITPEDWRNRKATNRRCATGVDRTSTALAPWTLVEANDKLYARIKVQKTICERLESALKR